MAALYRAAHVLTRYTFIICNHVHGGRYVSCCLCTLNIIITACPVAAANWIPLVMGGVSLDSRAEWSCLAINELFFDLINKGVQSGCSGSPHMPLLNHR